jgi:hypothetical protein
MPMEKVERAFGAQAVAALEELDPSAVGEAELGAEPTDFGVFMGDPLVAADQVVMAAFHHEGVRSVFC